MNNEISVTVEYQKYVPHEILGALANDLKIPPQNYIEKRIEAQANSEHFEEVIPAAIKIFISQHQSGIIEGLTVYAVCKALEKSYDALSSLKKYILSKVELEYRSENRKATFTIEQNSKDNKPIEKIAEVIESGKVNIDFENPDYHKHSNTNDLLYFFDESSGLWMPYNYKEQREEAIRRASEFKH